FESGQVDELKKNQKNHPASSSGTGGTGGLRWDHDVISRFDDAKCGQNNPYAAQDFFLMAQKKYLMCVHCDPVVFHNDIRELNTHFERKHVCLTTVKCGLCRKKFLHRTSLIRHIKNHIKKGNEEEHEDDNESVQSLHPVAGPSSTAADRQDFSMVEDCADDNENGASQGGPEQLMGENFEVSDFKKLAALFLLSLRSSGNLPNTSVSMIQDFVTELLNNILENVEHCTSKFISESFGVDREEASAFFSGPTFQMKNPFENLKTVEDQMEYFSEQFDMGIPVEKMLGSRIENRFDRTTRMFIPKTVLETFQYISLIDTPTLIKYPYAIRIILYYDDQEISNALGSKDTIHRLGCFYISVQNLPPEESSLLSSIFLLALTYAEYLKKPGVLEKVLLPFISDLNRLKSENGVEIDLPGGEKFILRASLVCVCADALAAHALLGLLSPSANMFCRLCLVSKKDILEDSTSVGLLRTAQLHQKHVDRRSGKAPSTA
ncbi:Zinc finger and BTB domain-containing protein 7C, partial [Frankliniella fusca]